MIVTQFSQLTNQEVLDRMSQTTFKSEDGNVYLAMDPIGASDIFQEVRNRFELFDTYINSLKDYLIAKAKECGDAATLRVRFHTINEIYEDLFLEKMPNSNPYIEGGAK